MKLRPLNVRSTAGLIVSNSVQAIPILNKRTIDSGGDVGNIIEYEENLEE